MAAKVIPAYGETYLGGSPHPLKVMKATYGHSTSLDQYVASSIGTTYRTLFTLPAGCLVDHITMYFKKGFTSTKMALGDTDNTSGWFSKASTGWKGTSNYRNSLNCGTAPVSAFKADKYYAAAGNIKMKNSTKFTTGEVHVYLFYSMAPNQ